MLVVAPWLSPRTREVLDGRGFSYLDLTGNVSIQLRQPAIFVRTEGEQRSPVPERRSRRGLSGSRAARLVRELVDVEPPRRANELAKATEISESYVSRLLDSVSDEALITRDGSVAQDLALLRTGDNQGRACASDVMLLQPMSDEAFDRPQRERVDGVECVGLSQLALDCLSGPGRMPAEGEAVLSWMQAHKRDWRETSPLSNASGAVS